MRKEWNKKTEKTTTKAAAKTYTKKEKNRRNKIDDDGALPMTITLKEKHCNSRKHSACSFLPLECWLLCATPRIRNYFWNFFSRLTHLIVSHSFFCKRAIFSMLYQNKVKPRKTLDTEWTEGTKQYTHTDARAYTWIHMHTVWRTSNIQLVINGQAKPSVGTKTWFKIFVCSVLMTI